MLVIIAGRPVILTLYFTFFMFHLFIAIVLSLVSWQHGSQQTRYFSVAIARERDNFLN
jgi:hypothetical protein